MKNPEPMFEAIVAIATIVDDPDTPPDERLEGIRSVLAAVGMLRVGVPRAPRAGPSPRTPAEERIEEMLKATDRLRGVRVVGPLSSTTPRSARPRAKPAPKPPPKETRKPEPKPLVDDRERQERIRREFTAGQRKKKRRLRKESK